MSDSQTVSASYLRGGSEDLGKGFWQQWQQYRDYLHRCCIKWMGGNPTDAEDALSRAMLKAWKKVQKYAAGEISNFKAWLTTLTRNLCVDIYRERSRGANQVEDIEGYASCEEKGLVRSEDTPEIALETGEKRIVIGRAIDNLPPRLHETFILHFYQELSYPEIAQQQEISYQNVCKRISQARAILRLELRGYFIEEEGTDTDKSVPPTATESAIGEMSQGNAPVEADAGETVTLSVAVEEVESVGDEEAIEVVRSGQACCPWQSVQHRKSVMVAATSAGKLEVKREGCGWEQEALCNLPPAPTLANAQFDQETGDVKENSGLPVLRMQEKPDVEERGGISAKVPHSEFLSSSQFSIPSQEPVGVGNEGKFLRCETFSNQPSPSVPLSQLTDVRLQLGKSLQLVGQEVETSAVYCSALPLVGNLATPQQTAGLIADCKADSQGAKQNNWPAQTPESDKADHRLALRAGADGESGYRCGKARNKKQLSHRVRTILMSRATDCKTLQIGTMKSVNLTEHA